jgi:hypothetical protein
MPEDATKRSTIVLGSLRMTLDVNVEIYRGQRGPRGGDAVKGFHLSRTAAQLWEG